MSTIEIKKEIHKAIDSAPDFVLNEIFSFIQQIKDIDSDKLQLSHNLNKILKEDKELLKRLSLLLTLIMNDKQLNYLRD